MITLQTKKHILNWQLNDPKAKNAIGVTMMEHIEHELSNLKVLLRSKKSGVDKPRVLVISAQPQKGTWVSGGNLLELAKLKAAGVKRYAQGMAAICFELTKLPIPVLIAVDGLVVGGGIELALAGDLIYATKASRFHFKQLDVGLCLGYGSNQRLVQAVGLSRAKNWVLTRQMVPSAEAMASGLVCALAEDGARLDKMVANAATGLVAIEPEVFTRQKQLLYLAHKRQAAVNLAFEQKTFLELWGNPQHAKFLTDFTRQDLRG